MIYKGVLSILSLHFKQFTDLIYLKIVDYVKAKLNLHKNELTKGFNDELLISLKTDLSEFGLGPLEIDITLYQLKKKFCDLLEQFFEVNQKLFDYYQKELEQTIYELILEKIADYIVNNDASKILLALNTKNIIPIELCASIHDLKQELLSEPEKYQNLKKFLSIKEFFMKKFLTNKINIESLESIQNDKDKLQIFYFIYRILEMFHLENFFVFDALKDYIKNKSDDWLKNLPLVSSKNPDLYFCGLFLASKLNIEIDNKKTNFFLNNLVTTSSEEFDSLLIQGTRRLYYLIKTAYLLGIKISLSSINKEIYSINHLIKVGTLIQYEPSRLVIIFKLYNLLQEKYGINLDLRISDIIFEEIEKRTIPSGLKQYREGLITAEACYYGLFYFYASNDLNKLEGSSIFQSIVNILSKNLELINFNENISVDLLKELLYSLESLELINCFNLSTNSMLVYQYLFPIKFTTILQKRKITLEDFKGKKYRIDKTTGSLLNETIL